MNKQYHVSKNGSDNYPGTLDAPFLTISKAAELAEENDVVIVHEGIYREHIIPQNSGRSNRNRITYMAAEGEKVIIKGSEVIDNWTNVDGGVYKTEIPNAFFKGYNPYKEVVDGDWLLCPKKPKQHTGRVYIDGASLLEQPTLDAVHTTPFSWYAQVDDKTVIYANFGDKNPTTHMIEINVRRECFAPNRNGVNFITLRGFEIAHAACPWAPPTAEQPGMVWTHWSKGWIIEDNILHDARCSAISLGKDISTGHNLSSHYHRKPGYLTQLEVVFKSLHMGWDKETIGSHIVRNNTIYDCGQNGIVGHMGGAFCEIYGNHIYNIAKAPEFDGHEIAGIKLHAAIDSYIHNNCIHDSKFAIWLDWQAQGVRVSCNSMYRNQQDLFVEVSVGPYLVDNNLMLSEEISLRNCSQGGAFVHNLFSGKLWNEPQSRATPYHLPHSTQIMGVYATPCGDDRFYQNIFLKNGTSWYNGSPASYAEYQACIDANIAVAQNIDVSSYVKQKLPVYINNNCYFGGAEPFDRETENIVSQQQVGVAIMEEEDGVFVEIKLPENVSSLKTTLVGTHNLPMAQVPEQLFEDAYGEDIVIDSDFLGHKRTAAPTPGPFESLRKGTQKFRIR